MSVGRPDRGAHRALFRSPRTRAETRVVSWLGENEWILVALTVVVAAVLGVIGFYEHAQVLGTPRSPLDILYLSLQLFTLESGSVSGAVPIELEIARFLAPAVVAYTAFKALIILFRTQIRRAAIRFLRAHVVVCGLGEKGAALVESFSASGHRVVAIDANAINSEIQGVDSAGAAALVGDATDPRTLERAGLHRARIVFAVCGDDSTNAEIAVRVREILDPRRRDVLTCFVHIREAELIRLLRERELTTQESDALRLEFFNLDQSGVRMLVSTHPPFRGEGSSHVLVVGATSTAVALTLGLGRLWHILGARKEWGRLQLTVVSQTAQAQTAMLADRYPRLSEVCDIVAVDAGTDSPGFLDRTLLDGGNGRRPVTAAYVCLKEDGEGVSAALTIRQHIGNRKIPIVVVARHEAGLTKLLTDSNDGSGDVSGFAMVERACSPDLLLGGTHEILARAMHDSWLRERAREGDTRETNPSVLPWERLPEDLRNSNRRQADHIGVKLRRVRRRITPLDDWYIPPEEFTRGEIEMLAEMEHERWLAERRAEGWKYGRTKDLGAKKSPYIVAWDELSPGIQDIDRTFIKELPAFLALAGYAIVPDGNGEL